MADMSASGLSIKSVEFILDTSLRRAPISSSLRTPHRDTGLRIISSSLDPRSMAERHPPPPLLSAPLSPAQPVPGPILGWGLFSSLRAMAMQPVANLSRLPICWTDCRCAYCIAVMTCPALLTKRSKPILQLSLVKPLRILLPRTRFLRHRIEAESSSLGDGPPVWRISSSHAQGQNSRFGFGPIIRLQPRLEPLFLSSETGHLGRRPNTPDRGRPSARDNPPGVPNPQRICMAALPIARLCRGERRWIKASTAAFVVTRPSKVSG